MKCSGESLTAIDAHLAAEYAAMEGNQTEAEAKASAKKIIEGEAAAMAMPLLSIEDVIARLSIAQRAADGAHDLRPVLAFLKGEKPLAA